MILFRYKSYGFVSKIVLFFSIILIVKKTRLVLNMLKP